MLTPVRSDAQWWRGTPADFEACADTAEKAKTREDKTAALMAKQHQQQEVQQVSLRTEAEKVPVPVASPVKQAARIKAANCARSSFSCEWPRLSEGINGLKKMFSATQNKAKKS